MCTCAHKQKVKGSETLVCLQVKREGMKSELHLLLTPWVEPEARRFCNATSFHVTETRLALEFW